MNHKRIGEISTEMSSLLELQRAFLNTSGLTQPMSLEELDGYAERNDRLRELCRELNEV
jgi:hypothetical protein